MWPKKFVMLMENTEIRRVTGHTSISLGTTNYTVVLTFTTYNLQTLTLTYTQPLESTPLTLLNKANKIGNR